MSIVESCDPHKSPKMEPLLLSIVDGTQGVQVDGDAIKEVMKEVPIPSSLRKKSSTVPKAAATFVDWMPSDFYKDAVYFVMEFGLPNEGENAVKISNVTKAKLLEVFGQDSKTRRSGYKLRKE